MSVVQTNVSVEEKSYALAQGVVKFVGDVKNALSSGWAPGQEVPAILQAALLDLVPVIQDLNAVPEELKDNQKAFVHAFLLSGLDLAYLFV